MLGRADSPLNSVATALHLSLRAQAKYRNGALRSTSGSNLLAGQSVRSPCRARDRRTRKAGRSRACYEGSIAPDQGHHERAVPRTDGAVCLRAPGSFVISRSPLRSGAPHDDPCGFRQNLAVKPKRPVADVLEVHPNPFVEVADAISASNLPETGNSGLRA